MLYIPKSDTLVIKSLGTKTDLVFSSDRISVCLKIHSSRLGTERHGHVVARLENKVKFK